MLVNKPAGVTKRSLMKTGKSKLNKPTTKPIRKPKINTVPVFLKQK